MAKIKTPQNLSEIQRNFYSIYHREISPMLMEWEKKRKDEFLKFILISIISITVTSVCIYKTGDSCFSAIFCFLAFGCIAGACYLLYKINDNFSRNLKQECMLRIVKAFGKMKWYQQTEMLSTSKINKSELFSNFNQREDDDVFLGKYKEVDFSVTETYLWYMSGSGRNKIVYSVFKGVIINFASNKKIRNKTMIATKGDLNIKGRNWAILIAILMMVPMFVQAGFALFSGKTGWNDFPWETVILYSFVAVFSLVILFLKKDKKEILHEIKLEDPQFNKYYKAYSSDEVEGRYLITTSFIERFKNLQTAFGARKAKCSFYGNDIMFAISTGKNLFEIGGLFTPLTNPKHMQKFFNELSSILALIDYFKLDEKTGL